MEELLVAAVVTSILVMTGVLINRNIRSKSSPTSNRWYAAFVAIIQTIILVLDLLIEDEVFPRLPFDIMLSVVCLSLLTMSLATDKFRKVIFCIFVVSGLLLANFYLLCVLGRLPVPTHKLMNILSVSLIIVYICMFLYFIWCKVRDIHSLMCLASVWAWLSFAVDVFYMLAVIVLALFFYLFSYSPYLMAILSLLMTALALAYMYRVNSNAVFALMHRHEKIIVESMKISPADAVEPGSGEEYMYKEIFSRVQKYFQEEKPYLNGALTINHVASEVFSNKQYISRAISHYTGRNFCQFVNYHRIMHAMECYRNNISLKVSELSPMSGFNTIVSFNMAFRLFMNENPSDWCRKEKMKLSRKRK